MIYGRGKCWYRALRLATCSAARRFASRRLNALGPRDAWRPMVLRWRQRRRRLGNMPAGRAAPQLQVSWFPQFQFHFASYMGDRTRRKPMPGLSPGGSQQKRVVIDRRWTSVPTATPQLKLDYAKPQSREIHERHSSRSKEHDPVTPAPRVPWPHDNSRSKEHAPLTQAPRVSWRPSNSRRKEHDPLRPAAQVSWLPFAQQLLTWPTHRARHQLFERTPDVRSKMQRGRQTQLLRTNLQISQHWHQVFSLRQPKFTDPVPHSASGRKALQFHYERPEELVWSRGLRTPLNSDDDKRYPELSESVGRTLARSQPGHEPAVSVAPLLERAAATQVTQLDPGFLDRLTDDVIRRVERHMRIERQRRGL